MIWTRQRRPPGKVLYAILWIGAVLIGLGFLGNLPHLVPDFVRDYSLDKASAFEVLAVQMIVWATGSFCILGIIDANKARREQGPKATDEYDAPSPGSVAQALPSSTLPESASPAPLRSLKEELFSLESERVTGRITQEEYDNARAALDTRLKLTAGVAEAESSQSVPLRTKVDIGVANARIKSVTQQRVEYLDEAGQSHIVNLEECARNWARRHNYQKSDIEWRPGTTEEEVAVHMERSAAWNSRCVGQRGYLDCRWWIEFADKRRTRLEFGPFGEAFELIGLLWQAGWYTFDMD